MYGWMRLVLVVGTECMDVMRLVLVVCTECMDVMG